MTEKKYEPPREQVEKLVASKTPEQLAVAYLRASRRAREAEATVKILAGVDQAIIGAVFGSDEDIKEGFEKARREIRTMTQTSAKA